MVLGKRNYTFSIKKDCRGHWDPFSYIQRITNGLEITIDDEISSVENNLERGEETVIHQGFLHTSKYNLSFEFLLNKNDDSCKAEIVLKSNPNEINRIEKILYGIFEVNP